MCARWRGGRGVWAGNRHQRSFSRMVAQGRPGRRGGGGGGYSGNHPFPPLGKESAARGACYLAGEAGAPGWRQQGKKSEARGSNGSSLGCPQLDMYSRLSNQSVVGVALVPALWIFPQTEVLRRGTLPGQGHTGQSSRAQWAAGPVPPRPPRRPPPSKVSPRPLTRGGSLPLLERLMDLLTEPSLSRGHWCSSLVMYKCFTCE